ncbi:MAG: hypothetical protein JO131_01385 [Gammaproteobacteria bacterium]|nr:hypothetical protein [Gammaproteobacteria bacterium]
MSYLKKQTEIPWDVLSMQLGAGYTEIRDFKKRFLKNLKEVLLYYNANVKEGEHGLLLAPSKSHIGKSINTSVNVS